MDTTEILERVLREDVLMPALFAGTVIVIVVVRTVGGVIRSVARERTRRDIAAFISEGTMTPEQGERLMRSGERD